MPISKEEAAAYVAGLSTDELLAFVADNLTAKRPHNPVDGGGKPRRGSVAEVMANQRAARQAKMGR
jgi:hypothetical protein